MSRIELVRAPFVFAGLNQLPAFLVKRMLVWPMFVLFVCGGQALAADMIGDGFSEQASVRSLIVRDFSINGFDTDGLGYIKKRKLSQRKLMQLAHKERLRHGDLLSVDQLHQIAEALTLYVRQQGFKFHTVYLPEQQVVDGIVKLRCVDATLADVNIINNTDISDEVFSQPFEFLRHRALYSPQVEQKIFALRAQAGVKIFSYFSRGKLPGDMRLNIRVQSRQSSWWGLGVDNYGGEISGQHRLVGDFRLHHLLAGFDALNVVLFQTLDGQNSRFSHASYQWNLDHLNASVRLSAGDSQYELGKEFSRLDLSGKANTYRADFKYYLNHNPNNRQNINVAHYQKNSNLESDFSASLDTLERSVANVAGLSWRRRIGRSRWLMAAGFDYVDGKYESTLTNGVERPFNKTEYHFNLSYPSFSRAQFAFAPSLTIRGQYADEPLPGLESIGLSGYYAVRAFKSGAFSADSGVISSLNLGFNHIFDGLKKPNIKLLPYLFYDHARGDSYTEIVRQESNDDDSGVPNLVTERSRSRRRLEGYGVGIHAKIQDFSASLSYARHLSTSLSNDAQSNQWLFELRWH